MSELCDCCIGSCGATVNSCATAVSFGWYDECCSCNHCGGHEKKEQYKKGFVVRQSYVNEWPPVQEMNRLLPMKF
jgi:hypothetical protein